MSGVKNVDGYSLTFYDHPNRIPRGFNIYWRAELSLAGKIGGVYHEITTLKHGFNVSAAGSYSIQPLFINSLSQHL